MPPCLIINRYHWVDFAESEPKWIGRNIHLGTECLSIIDFGSQEDELRSLLRECRSGPRLPVPPLLKELVGWAVEIQLGHGKEILLMPSSV